MFQLISQFWSEILLVFIPRSPNTVFNIYHRYVSGGYDVTSNIRGGAVNFNNLVNALSLLSLIGLCVFLFYQLYKIIHALIGGTYE